MYLPTVTRFWQPPIYVDQCWSFISLIFFNYDKCQFRWLHRCLWKLESNIVAIDGYQSKAPPHHPTDVQKKLQSPRWKQRWTTFRTTTDTTSLLIEVLFFGHGSPKKLEPHLCQVFCSLITQVALANKCKHMETTHISSLLGPKQEIWMTYGESV